MARFRHAPGEVAESPQGYRAIERRADNIVIGKCGFFPYLLSAAKLRLYSPIPAPAVADACGSRIMLGIGYGLCRTARGSGYASEAIGSLIRFAFEELHVDSVWARTMRYNEQSIALMRRVGMRVAFNPDPDPEAWPGALGMISHPALTQV